MQIYVTKRDGSKEYFNADRINKSIERACFGLDDPISKVVQIATESRLMLYDGITTEELDYATINAALQNVQEDTSYDKIATRLLLKTVYKRIFGDYGEDKKVLQEKYKKYFINHIKNEVESGILDKRMTENFNLQKLADAINIERDEFFKYAGNINFV